MAPQLNPVPLVEAGDLRLDKALAVRDACLGWLPCGDMLARLGDPVMKRWMWRRTPYAGEIDEIDRKSPKGAVAGERYHASGAALLNG